MTWVITQLHQHDKKNMFCFHLSYNRKVCTRYVPAYFLYPQQHLRRGSPVKALFGLVVRVHKMLKKRKYFLPNFQLFKKKLYRGKLTPPPFSRKAYWISLYPNLCCCLPLRCSGRAAWWASSAWSCSQSRPPAHWRTGVVHVRSTSTTF